MLHKLVLDVDIDDAITQTRVDAGLVDMLIYGATGVYKTPMLASVSDIPELLPAVFVDIEDAGHQADKKGIEVFNLNVIQDLLKQDKGRAAKAKTLTSTANYLFQSLKDSWYEAKRQGASTPFNCLIIDGWTELYEIVHREIVSESKGDKDVGTQGDRMRAFVYIKRMVRLIRSIPVHVFSSAREYEFRNDQGSLLSRTPHLSGQTSKYVAAQSDIVARMRMISKTLQFSVQEDSVTIARDRFNKLPPQIKFDEKTLPNLKKIWGYLRKGNDDSVE